METVRLPSDIKNIPSECFSSCYSLKSITIPNSVEKIDDSAFPYCSSITSVTIPDSVKEIGSGAFYWCEELSEVIGANNVERIGYNAFGDTAFTNSNGSYENGVLYVGKVLYKTIDGINGDIKINNLELLFNRIDVD